MLTPSAPQHFHQSLAESRRRGRHHNPCGLHGGNFRLGVAFAAVSLASDDFSIPRAATIAGALCLVAFAMKKLLGVQLPLY